MSFSGIYKITNVVTEKIYIGSAVNLVKRWLKHKRYANGNYHHSITFQRSWNLHGEEAFIFEVIEYCDKESLVEREQYWMDLLKPFNSDIGYNICKTSKNHLGLIRSEEARNNMRNSQLGKEHSQEHKDNIAVGNRKFDKWPCLNGSNCKCDICKSKRAAYVREKRWANEDAGIKRKR